MILFKCQCGQAQVLENEYVGGSVKCRQCGQRAQIPQRSDPDVVLIFKASEGEEGRVPMTRVEVQSGLLAGILQPTDMIWKREKWVPLSKAFPNAADLIFDSGDMEKTRVRPKPGSSADMVQKISFDKKRRQKRDAGILEWWKGRKKSGE